MMHLHSLLLVRSVATAEDQLTTVTAFKHPADPTCPEDFAVHYTVG
ncbi:MAG: hypothetical protein WCC84_07380 [Candidatus Cybelea sp.]